MKHHPCFSEDNLYFCISLLTGPVIEDVKVLKLVASCGENGPKYSTHKNLNINPQYWTPKKQRTGTLKKNKTKKRNAKQRKEKFCCKARWEFLLARIERLATKREFTKSNERYTFDDGKSTSLP